jgi:predicted HTH transcriptional regulator
LFKYSKSYFGIDPQIHEKDVFRIEFKYVQSKLRLFSQIDLGWTNQEKILGLIRSKPEITRKEFANVTGITSDGIKYHLDKMRKQNMIRHTGATKKGQWEIVEDKKNE